jgi:chemotaxis protein MotB
MLKIILTILFFFMCGCAVVRKEVTMEGLIVDEMRQEMERLSEENKAKALEIQKLKDEIEVLREKNSQQSLQIENLSQKIKESKESLKEKENLVEEMRVEAEKLRVENQKLKESLKQILREKESFRAEIDELKEAKEILRAEVRRIEEEKAQVQKKLMEENQKIKKEFEEYVKKSKIELEEVRGKIILTLIDEVFFDSGKAQIKKEALPTLDKVADVLKQYPERLVFIEGHTDNVPICTPKFKSNWELSVIRATEVLRYLQLHHKINPTRLAAVGYGEYRPRDTNETQEGRRNNRRVEIILLPPNAILERR